MLDKKIDFDKKMIARTVAVLYASQNSGMGDVGKFVAWEAWNGATVKVAALSVGGVTKGIDKAEIDVTYDDGAERLAGGLKEVPITQIDVKAATAEQDIAAIVEGADAVVACLGSRQPFQDRWAAKGTEMTMNAMEKMGVDRLVILNSFGIGDDFMPKTGFVFKYLWPFLLNTLLRTAKKDLQRQEALVHASSLDYLLVKPVGLTPEVPPAGKWKLLTAPNQGLLNLSVSKHDVASYMLSEALHPTLHRAIVSIGAKDKDDDDTAATTTPDDPTTVTSSSSSSEDTTPSDETTTGTSSSSSSTGKEL